MGRLSQFCDFSQPLEFEKKKTKKPPLFLSFERNLGPENPGKNLNALVRVSYETVDRKRLL